MIPDTLILGGAWLVAFAAIALFVRRFTGPAHEVEMALDPRDLADLLGGETMLIEAEAA